MNIFVNPSLILAHSHSLSLVHLRICINIEHSTIYYVDMIMLMNNVEYLAPSAPSSHDISVNN